MYLKSQDYLKCRDWTAKVFRKVRWLSQGRTASRRLWVSRTSHCSPSAIFPCHLHFLHLNWIPCAHRDISGVTYRAMLLFTPGLVPSFRKAVLPQGDSLTVPIGWHPVLDPRTHAPATDARSRWRQMLDWENSLLHSPSDFLSWKPILVTDGWTVARSNNHPEKPPPLWFRGCARPGPRENACFSLALSVPGAAWWGRAGGRGGQGWAGNCLCLKENSFKRSGYQILGNSINIGPMVQLYGKVLSTQFLIHSVIPQIKLKADGGSVRIRSTSSVHLWPNAALAFFFSNAVGTLEALPGRSAICGAVWPAWQPRSGTVATHTGPMLRSIRI